ncbi:MAG: DUF3467 domain-containing protein [Petrimonas sp.]|nr:DUF3467 domain-containing protein [Christensenella sp.]MEA4948415.1 DUF3467 domain-containing protein [Petrimonas sp.]
MEKSIYSNALMINVSPYDISILFSTVDPLTPGEPADNVRVYLSPQHAKIFSLMLEKNIKVFEEFSGGEIILSQEVISKLLGDGSQPANAGSIEHEVAPEQK